MADISGRITRKSLAAKKKAAIKTIKLQTKEKIRAIKEEYAANPERLRSKAEEKEHKKELRIQKSNARISYNQRQPRPYSLGEDIFNSVTHGIAAGLSVAAIVLLAVQAYFSPDKTTGYVASFTIYGISLFLTFFNSTMSHALHSLRVRRIFEILCRDSIYFLIASTFTCFLLKDGHTGAIPAVWIVAVCLAALYSSLSSYIQGFALLTYVVFGWTLAGIFGTEAVMRGNAPLTSVLIFSAAVTYSAGAVFAVMRNMRLSHCVFHFLCLVASILQFFAIYYLI